MRKKDDFDDEFAESSAFSTIMNALDLRAKFEARKPVYATSIVVAMVAVLGGVIWYSYPKESAQREVMNTPIVRADASAYRVAPQEPGGMAIPYRESTVFNTLRSEERTAQGRVENLLPEAEQPLSRQELFAGLKVDETDMAPGVSVEGTDEAVADSVADASSVVVDEMAVAQEMAAQVKAQVKPEAAPVVEKSAEKIAEKTPEKVIEKTVDQVVAKADDVKAKAAAKIEPAVGVAKEINDSKITTTTLGGYYVQLGSVRERSGAAGEWAKLQKSFAVLAPLNMRVQEADLGAKGKFFRIQGGPLTEAQAKQICESVKAQKPGGCLVVKQ